MGNFKGKTWFLVELCYSELSENTGNKSTQYINVFEFFKRTTFSPYMNNHPRAPANHRVCVFKRVATIINITKIDSSP